MAQSVQLQNVVQSPGNGSGSGSSKSTYMICIPICMPKCAQQCISQQHIASGTVESMTSITGGSLGPIISQKPSSIVPQEPMPLITPQGVVGGPSPNIAHGSMISQGSGQMLPQGSGSVIPSQNIQIIPQGSSPMNPTQGTQMMPQFAGIVPQASDCVSACMPACSVPCARQNLATSQAIGSLVYVTPPSTYVPNPGKVEPATQQSTKECLAACMQQCNAQCIQNQPQPLPLTPEPVPIQSQATSIPTQFRASVHLQPLVTECLPSATIEIECVCPRGFIVCVGISGSNQCCSSWWMMRTLSGMISNVYIYIGRTFPVFIL